MTSARALFASMLVLAAAGSASALPSLAYKDQTIYPMYTTSVYLTAGQTYTFTTGLTTAYGDPVLHLWGPRYVLFGTPTNYGDLGHDDDSAGGVNARVVVTPAWTGWHTLIVHASTVSAWGNTTLYQNGVAIRSAVSFAGTPLAVRSSTSTTYYEYEAAPVPGGSEDTLLYALDCNGALLGWDDFGGVGDMGRIAGRANVCTIVLDSRAPARATLYTNDVANDHDGDGLGSALEAWLQTCDNTVDPQCTSVANPRDTDRDGLEDSAEVFGLDTNPPQYLSKWGANPRHKDLFLELDWWAGSGGHTAQPITPAFIAGLEAIYDGSNDDLLNPDGQDGVRLHVDIGIAPTDPSETSYGNWGGSNAITDTSPDEWWLAINRDMVAARQGVFRHGYLEKGACGGSGWVPSRQFHVAVNSSTAPECLAHELGHTVGLNHYGHPSWGGANCKPNYKSLMNYVYGGSAFSLGAETPVINAVALNEVVGVGGDPAFLSADPWRLPTHPWGLVDWNRSGTFDPSSVSVRAAVTLADAECNALDQNRQTLRAEGVGPGLPDLVRWSNRLFVFYVDTAGVIRYRSGQVTGADAQGSCPLGDTQMTEGGCMTFNAEQSVPSARRATSVTVINGSGGLLVAFRSTSGEVVTIRAATLLASGDLSGWTGETVQASYTDGEPELALLPVNAAVYGSSTAIALVYTYLGTYRWLSTRYTNEAFVGRGALMRGDDVAMPGSLGVSLASWPHLNPTTACGAFADPDKKLGVYCWNRDQSRFVEAATGGDFLVGGAAPTTYGKPGFAFHQVRTSTGANVGDGLGQFWLSHTVYDARNKAVSPRVYISSPVSATSPPGSSMKFVHSAHVATYWAISPNTSAALYEDYALSALKGARLHIYPKADDTNTTRIDFLPFADGTFDAPLRDGNDFQVMERAICLGLRADDEYCGPANKFNY